MDSIASKTEGPFGRPPTVVYFIDGTKFYMHFEPPSKFFLDPAMVRFFLTSWGLWIILQHRMTEATASELPMIFTYVFLGAVLLGSIILATIITVRATRFFGQSFIYTPMVTIPVIVVHDLSEWLLLGFFAADLDITLAQFLLRLLQNFVAFSLLDYFCGHFVAPLMNKSLAIPANKPTSKTSGQNPKSTPTPTPTPIPTPKATDQSPQQSKPDPRAASAAPPELPLTFLLQGQIVQTSKLVRVDAEDHYIRIFEGSRSKLVRGKFADAMKQIPDDLGIQISRSQWVGRKHIAKAEHGQTSKLFLSLKDGEVMPVARSRRCEAKSKLTRWKINITSDLAP